MGTDFCSICCVHSFKPDGIRSAGSLEVSSFVCGAGVQPGYRDEYVLPRAFFYVPLPSIKSNENIEEEAERLNDEKKNILLGLEQLPYLHHRPHETSPHTNTDSHQFENFNLIEIEWTNERTMEMMMTKRARSR